jgi:hypothetical protein
LWKSARAIPSLDLDFAGTKSLKDGISNQDLITFTRASSGTYVGNDGVLQTAVTDAPRFDHNPTTGESLGLLVEEARTNNFTASEDFSNIDWIKTLATVSTNVTNDPALLPTADKLVEDVTNGEHQISRSFPVVSGTTYTISLFVKAAGRTFCRFGFTGLGFAAPTRSTFGLSTGTITTNAGGSPTITALGNGWYRLSVTNTATSSTAGSFIIQPQTDSSTSSYTGDGTSGLFLWGAQLEAGSGPSTSYIPTTTATVTRAADVASITGTNFSQFYNQTEGTMFASGIIANNGVITVVDDGTFNNRKPQFTVGASSATDCSYVTTGSVIANFSQASSANVLNRWATAYATDDFGFSANNLAPVQDSSGTLPSGNNTLRLGSFHNGSSNANGTIRRLTYWPTRLSNTTLQAITHP